MTRDPGAVAGRPVEPGTAVASSGTRTIPAAMPAASAVRAWAAGLDLAWQAWAPELAAVSDRLDLQPGDRVLDAGCGSGPGIRMLARRVAPGGLVVGVDTDPEALGWAAWSLRDLAGQGSSVELWQEDLTALPFPDDAFDAAWCSSVLGYLADPGAALRELVRVVRPGGRIVVISGDAARHTFLPIEPELESRLRDAELRAVRDGVWGADVDIHLGRRLYGLASRSGAARVTPLTLVWERTAPLTSTEHRYLARLLDGLTGPAVAPYLGPDLDVCRSVLDPAERGCVLHRPDLHVVQTATGMLLEVSG